MKRVYSIVALSILMLASLSSEAALTISVAPAEAAVAVDPKAGETPIESFISGCLDSLFDAGIIATTSPTKTLNAEQWGDRAFGLQGAREGFVDLVVALYVVWKPSVLKKGVLVAAGCDYRILRVSSGAVVASGHVNGSGDSPEAAADPDKAARMAGAEVGRVCLPWILRASNGGEG